MSESNEIFDVVIVGGGSAGLSAAQALGRANRKVIVLDTGLPRNRFAEQMHTVMGFDGQNPLEIIQKAQREVASYGVPLLKTEVARVQDRPREPNETQRLDVTAVDGSIYTTRSILTASGLTDVLPQIPGLAERWGKTVAHCPYCHGWEFLGQRIAALATSPFGLHQVELLRQWSDQITLLSAGVDPLDLSTTLRLEAREISIEPNSVVKLSGTDLPGPIQVILDDNRSIEVDVIFTIGKLLPNDEWLNDLELERTDTPVGSFLTTNEYGRTSHARVWAAGNVSSPMANLPMASSQGVMVGAAINTALVNEEFDVAEAAGPPLPLDFLQADQDVGGAQ